MAFKSLRSAVSTVSVLTCALLSMAPTSARAAEAATSFYLLGSNSSMAGFAPLPGTYLVDLNYFYAGSASGSAALSLTSPKAGVRDGANRALTLDANLNVSASAYYQIPTLLWVAPNRVLDGNFGLSFAAPIGAKRVNADIDAVANLTLPKLGTSLTAGQRLSLEDGRGAFGDPTVGAFLGWHQGNLHWRLGTMLNVPLGAWDRDRMANIGFNRWAIDVTGAVTWLDLRTGLELSTAAGFTFNGENPATNYRSGTEFHLEFAAMQNLSKQFAIGVVGYHYQQITGDSGAGASLGDFKGRVSAIGPQVNYTFMVGKMPVSTSLKWTHEFDVENRLKGDMALLTLTLPIGGP
jgi:hypothetical protein